MFSDHRGRSGWTMCPCILQLGCMGTFVSRSKRFIQASRVAGGDMDVPLATIRLRGLSLPGNVPRRGAPVGPRTEEPDEPSYFMEQAVSKRTAHGAKQTLAELSGVRPADGADDMERPKRDRPRLAFRPFHALVAILALSCALCVSLTMLVQQAMHYGAMQRSQTAQSQEQSKQQQSQQTGQEAPQQAPQQTQTTQEPQEQPAEPTQPQSNQIDINTAGLEELQTLKGVGPVTAQRILDYRARIGRFDSIDQLLEVKGIGAKTLAKFREQACVR